MEYVQFILLMYQIFYEDKHFNKNIQQGGSDKISKLFCPRTDKIHFHSLRHSFCSNLVQKRVSLYVVKNLAGHQNFSFTQQYQSPAAGKSKPGNKFIIKITGQYSALFFISKELIFLSVQNFQLQFYSNKSRLQNFPHSILLHTFLLFEMYLLIHRLFDQVYYI